MRHAIAAMSLLLAGCAAPTGVMPAGPDTYAIHAHGFAAERSAMLQAGSHCAKQNREFVPVSREATGDARYPSGYAVTFRCLPANDPEVKNYRPDTNPAIRVESR